MLATTTYRLATLQSYDIIPVILLRIRSRIPGG